jgi:hypothetical protein
MTSKNSIALTVMREVEDRINHETIYRGLAIDIIKRMSIEELAALFAFKKTDPFSEESKRRILSFSTPGADRDYLLSLQNQNVVVFEAVLKIEVAP